LLQKQEKEIANIRPVAKITHKGEIAIQEDLSDLTENFSKRDSVSAPTVKCCFKIRVTLTVFTNQCTVLHYTLVTRVNLKYFLFCK